MSSIDFIKDQIEVVDRYASSWQAEHPDAMECMEADERVKFMLFVFSSIDELDRTSYEMIMAGNLYANQQFHEHFAEMVVAYKIAAEKIIKQASKSEKKGYRVVGIGELRHVCEGLPGSMKMVQMLTDSETSLEEKSLPDDLFDKIEQVGAKFKCRD